jgi:hypothetical protein
VSMLDCGAAPRSGPFRRRGMQPPHLRRAAAEHRD